MSTMERAKGRAEAARGGAVAVGTVGAETARATDWTRELAAIYRGQPVLVTGGMGFIGSNLAIALQRIGAHVTVLDSMLPEFGANVFNLAPAEGQVRVNISDMRDRHALRYLVQGQRCIFNLAGQVSHVGSMVDPLMDLEINVRAQVLLLETCRSENPDVRIVHASSRHVYGKAQYLPVDEDHPTNPLDVYSIDKLAGEHYQRVYGAAHRMKTTILRLTNTYGPRQNALDAVGVFVRQAVMQKPLTVYGEGSQVRDYTYVDDACSALLLAGARQETVGEVYNVGGASHCSIRAFAEQLAAIAQVPVVTVPFPAERAAIEIGDFYTDDRKFRDATGWAPRVPLDQGLHATYEYFAAHREPYGLH